MGSAVYNNLSSEFANADICNAIFECFNSNDVKVRQGRGESSGDPPHQYIEFLDFNRYFFIYSDYIAFGSVGHHPSYRIKTDYSNPELFTKLEQFIATIKAPLWSRPNIDTAINLHFRENRILY